MQRRVVGWLPGLVLLCGCAETVFHPAPDTFFVAVSAGGTHSCALDQDGRAWCWGSNSDGQLGIVRRHQRQLSPVAVNGTLRFRSISAGDRHTCAVELGGRGWCWGANDAAQLGDGTRTARDAPRPVIDAPAFTEISAGGAHSCGLAGSGRVYCWGANESLQLGADGATAPLPRAVPGLAGVLRLSTGGRHTCAIDGAGPICWGANDALQLGAPPRSARSGPVRPPVPGGLQVSAGLKHSCALASGGRVLCWGTNPDGRSDPGGAADPTPPARVVLPTSEPALIAAGGDGSCAAGADGLWCWGGVGDDRLPRQVAGVTDSVSALAAGGGHACAVVGGAVKCWGEGSEGQLGHGRRTDSEIAVP